MFRSFSILLPLFFLFLISGCKKYEEDEFISLRKGKKRLKIWSPFNSTEVKVNGQKLEEVEWTFGFEKDQDFKWRITFPNQELEREGTWSMSDDRESVLLDYSNGGQQRWKIRKLYRKELIMEYRQGVDEIIYKGKGH